MKLISVNIVNFGKLHNVDFSFDNNLNVICKRNGWGKSTIATFIKVMFYGFDGENKRDDINCERKRYFPWQGGNYGGSVTFSVEGSVYTLTRFFYEKASLDEFELRDATTNLISEDFSVNIGEEIFKISSESFAKTSFIGQNDCVFEGTAGDINSRIGNIDDLIDLNRYENAANAIKDRLNEMSPSRKTGEIYRLKSRLSDLKSKADAGRDIPDRMTETQKNISALSGEIENISSQIQIIHSKRMAQADRINLIKLHNHFETMQNELNEKKERYIQAINDRDNSVNSLYKDVNSEELDEMIALSRHLDIINDEAGKLAFTTDEKEEFDTLYNSFGTIQNPVETVSYYIDLNNKNAEINADIVSLTNDNESLLNNVVVTDKRIRKIKSAVILGFIILATGILLSAFGKVFAPNVGLKEYYMFLAGGITCDVVAIVVWIASIFKAIDLAADKSQYETCITDNNGNIMSLNRVIDDNNVRINAFIEALNMNPKGLSVTEQLKTALSKASIYVNLLKKESDGEAIYLLNDYDTKYDIVSGYVISHKIVVEDSITEALIIFRNHFRDYKKLEDTCSIYEAQVTEAFEHLKKFIQDNPGIDTMVLTNDTQDESDEISLEQREQLLKEEFDETLKKREDERRTLALLAEQYEVYKDTVEEISETELIIADKNTEFDIFSKTREYLSNAKESLTSRYMEPLLSGFRKYYSSIKGAGVEEYSIDANFNLTYVYDGKQRDIKHLSSGYQNLVGMCMRLAMIDIMYPAEKPVLIFDDPFVNMDDETIAGARKLLDIVSDIYQVIYISCSSSRI